MHGTSEKRIKMSRKTQQIIWDENKEVELLQGRNNCNEQVTLDFT
jgi:hypothetical protein